MNALYKDIEFYSQEFISRTGLKVHLYDGIHVTLNQNGVMLSKLDVFCKEFIKYALENKTEYSMEVASAYGLVSYVILKLGGRVITNDIDQRHLDVLLSVLSEDEKRNLIINCNSFPSNVKIKENSLNNILISQLFHFFTGEQIINSLKTAHSFLKKGGKIFITAASDKSGLISLFSEKEQESFKKPWGGYLKNIKYHPKISDIMTVAPDDLHLLSPEVLTYALTESGFDIINIEYIDRVGVNGPKGSVFILDGREGIGAIAVKK